MTSMADEPTAERDGPTSPAIAARGRCASATPRRAAPARHVRRGDRRVAQVVARRASSTARPQPLLRGFGEYVCRALASARRRDLGAARPLRAPHALARAVLGRARSSARAPRARALRGVDSRACSPSARRDPRDIEAARVAIRVRGSYVGDLERADARRQRAARCPGTAFTPRRSPRMRSTYAADPRAARRRARPALSLRATSRRAGEGAFWICGFWAVEHLARGGGIAARRRARCSRRARLCERRRAHGRGDRARERRALGNFPQAYTHVGLDQRRAAQLEAGARRARGGGR